MKNLFRSVAVACALLFAQETHAQIVYEGGKIIRTPQVAAIYMGPEWNSDPGLAAERVELDAFFTYLLQSPYMDGLFEYGVRRGAFWGSVVGNYDPLSDSDIAEDLGLDRLY
jgi:hypothetical protein